MVNQNQQSRRRPTRMRVLWAGAIVATLTVSIIISIALWGWIGLVIVSVVIAAGALWFFISSTRSTPSLRATSGGGSSRDVLQTWSGLAAIGSGILAVSAVVTMWLPELRGVAYLVVFSSLFGLSILLLAIALPGLRTRQAGLVRRPGRAGFILAMIGVVPFSAFIAFLGISGVLPAAAFSAVGGVGTWWLVLQNVVGVLGPTATLVGIAVFGIATARANVLPRWAAVMFALGWPIGIASAVIYSVFFLEARVVPNETRGFLQLRVALSVGLPIFALGLIRLGYALWAHGRLKKNLSKLLLPELSRPTSSRSRMPGTGFGDKTVWDWLQLLIVPIMLAVASFWFTLQQDIRQQATEEQRAQDTALQAHFDKIGELMLKEDGSLRESEEGDEVNTLARSRTLTVLSRLDGDRKARVVQFLYEAHLIAKDHPVIDLRGADLSEVSLNNADLRSANLSGANLRDADLREADVLDAVMDDADLEGAKGPTEGNLEFDTKSLEGATMPDGSIHE